MWLPNKQCTYQSQMGVNNSVSKYLSLILVPITEKQLRANRKHVLFFAYNLRMERGTVLILTSLSAQCQYL